MGLDAVEIVVAWEEAFGISITDAEAAGLRTPRMAVDLICRKLNVGQGGSFCLSQRIFYRLRSAFVRVLSIPRASITPRTRLGSLIPILGRQQVWSALSKAARLPLPATMIGVGSFSPTVGDFTRCMTGYSARFLVAEGCGWSQHQVRALVREAVALQLGITEFSDDADFVYDLRID